MALPAISFSRGSSQPREQTWVSNIVGRPFIIWATTEVVPEQDKHQIHISYYKSQQSGHRIAPFLSADQPLIIILVLSKISRDLNSMPTEGKALGNRKCVYLSKIIKNADSAMWTYFGDHTRFENLRKSTWTRPISMITVEGFIFKDEI